MSKTPFMPLWVDNFLGDTLDLDAKEVGAYMLILMAMWRRGGCLPADQSKLKRVARVGRGWAQVWESIGGYFDEADGQISQARLLEEYEKARTKSTVNATSGALGGRAKALKYKEAALANATDSPKQSESELEDTLSSNDDKAADAAVVDPVKVLFDSAIALLGQAGIDERRARPLVGKWRKQAGDEALLAALGKAQREGAIEPVAFIEGCLKAQGRPNGKPRNGEIRTLPSGRKEIYDNYAGWEPFYA